ncbi:hypothetical protein niasHS_011327 [Heterodera schachtii]|uniref:BTB domain-containing protein n=1 Tax=Heterodera schachtii TaxID=97005 RepID=A0ABD2IJU0_HETSC
MSNSIQPISVRMKHLLSTGEYADVKFLVGDGDAKELLQAHKLILRSASEVFVAMFRFDSKNAKADNASANCLAVVEIPDVEAAAFKVMLSFIYADDLSELNGDNAMAVLCAAKKYIIPDLVLPSLQIPFSELRNVFLAYAQARLFDFEEYCNDCLDYIDKNADALLKSEEFLQIDQKLLCEILGPENRRQLLGPALFKIRLPLFSHNEFTVQIVPSGILIAEEEVGIKQYRSQSKIDEFVGEKVGSRRFSETVQIRGLPWNILAKINGKTDEKWLGFYLQCAAAEEDENWCCECSATFRIVSQKFDVENSTGKFFGQIFDHTADQAGFDGFISFAELMDPNNEFYSNNEDKVTLTVDLILKDAKMDQFSVPKTADKTIFMEIEKASEFFCEIIGSERKSETVLIKGLSWKIVAKINRRADDEKCLGFYLLCAVPKKTPNWSRKCSATFRIVSGAPREWFERRIVSNETPIHGFDYFVTFSYLQSDIGGYDTEEDKVTLAIDICVDDEKKGKTIVSAHRAILSSASDVFKAMFRYDKGQIEVTDIEIGAFKAMLTFIYTKHFNGLDANNWLDVLKAADKYNIIGLVKKCADFPIEKLPNVFVAFEKAMLLNMEALRWADEHCRQKGIECSAEKRREMLGPALFNIRFPLIPKEEFTKSIVSTGVLTKEESDAPGLFPSKFPTQQRYKYEDTIEMEIEKVSEFALEAVESRRFSDAVDIGGMPWKIMAEINTKNESNEKWLGFYLYNDGTEKENLSCKSSTTFRIVSQKNGTEDLIGTFNDRIFDKNVIAFGFANFISFAELLDPSKGIYNKDEDKVKLAIDVIIDEPKTEKFISDPNKSNGTLSMEIEKLSEFAREIIWSERKSETLYIKGMPWKIEAQIKKKNESTDNNEKWLGFTLWCDASEKYGNWSRKCSATFRIVSQKSDVEDFKKEFGGMSVFNNKVLSRGWTNFISFAVSDGRCN